MSTSTMPRTGRTARREVDARQAPARRARPSRATSPRPARRISGPVSGRTRTKPAREQSITVGARALAVVRSLPDRSLVDRLVRGRAWIPVLGVLLVGLVAMQVEILKLGTGLGRSLQHTTSLQTQNETLQASVATLADDQRIERLAAGMGMVMPTPGMLTFVSADERGQLGRALASIHASDPAGFALQLADLVARAALITPVTSTAPSTTSQSSTAQAGTATTPGATQASTQSATQTAASSTASTDATQSGSAQSPATSGPAASPTPVQPTAPPTDTGPSAIGSPTSPTTTSAPVAGSGANGAAALPSTSQSAGPIGG